MILNWIFGKCVVDRTGSDRLHCGFMLMVLNLRFLLRRN